MRFLGVASVAGIIGVAGVAGAITIRGDGTKVTETSAGNVMLHQEGKAKPRTPHMPRPLARTPAREPVTVAAAAADPTDSVPPTPVPSPTPVSASAPAPASIAPTSAVGSLLGQGRTSLTDSIYAVRSGDSVTVNFDTRGNRTGRADKFELMVRETLPLVYGHRNTASIDSVPTGSLLPSRDVVGELTARGMHLTLENGVKIALWPKTRSTSDGPLVVSYLIVVER